MRCPNCGAGLTKWGGLWLCTFCKVEYLEEEVKNKSLDSFLKKEALDGLV